MQLGRLVVLTIAVVVCAFVYCNAAPRELNTKPPYHSSEARSFHLGKARSLTSNKESRHAKKKTTDKETLLAKLHEEGEKADPGDEDASVTRLAASGDYTKGKEHDTLGDGSGYWGDIAGDDLNSSLDHELEDTNGEDGAESSGTRNTTDNGKPGSDEKATRVNAIKSSIKKDFGNVIKGSKEVYKSSEKKGSFGSSKNSKNLKAVKGHKYVKSGNGKVPSTRNGIVFHANHSKRKVVYVSKSIKRNAMAKQREKKLKKHIEKTPGIEGGHLSRHVSRQNSESHKALVNTIAGIAGINREALTESSTVVTNDQNHQEADDEDLVGPYIASLRENEAVNKDDIFNVLENAYGRNLDEGESKFSGSGENDDDEHADDTIIRSSGTDELIGSDEVIGSDDNASDDLREFSGNHEEPGQQNDAIKGRKVNVGHLKHQGKNKNSHAAYVPIKVPLVMSPHPKFKYVYIPISNVKEKGAVCLDGSAPGYFFRFGSGKGVDKWIIYLQGGAWCDSEENCYERSKTPLGSSLSYSHLMNAAGILSHSETENRYYYNWNVVYVPYCDGASFTGNRSEPLVVEDRTLYFRGKRILGALLDDLLINGLQQSSEVVFTGTSAGGLAVMLNADYLKERLPSTSHLLAMADSGVFLNVPNIKGIKAFPESMERVYNIHDPSDSINPKCAAKEGKKKKWHCLFPASFGEFLKTPLYLINPLYDSWQLANVIGIHCVYHPKKCTKKEMKVIKEFRKKILDALKPMLKNERIGIFGNDCIDHGQVIFSKKWDQIVVGKLSMQDAFYKWSRNEMESRELIDADVGEDDVYPFNPTCWSHFK